MYVRKEYLYYQIASMGNNYSVEAHRGSWTEYLEEHFQIIETGFQFPRLAVQEPQGVMVLRVSNLKERIINIFIIYSAYRWLLSC